MVEGSNEGTDTGSYGLISRVGFLAVFNMAIDSNGIDERALCDTFHTL